MKLRSVFARTIFDARRALVGYAIGLLALVAMIVSIWPSFESQQEEFQRLLDSYPPAFKAAFDIQAFDAPGFLKGELFSFMLPLLFLIFGIGRGADVLAGEEERGALDVLLTHPRPRRRVLLEKAAGIGVSLTMLALLVFVALALATPLVGLDVGTWNLAGMTLMLLLLALVFAALGLALGAALGRRGLALGIASAIAAGTYLAQTLARLVHEVEWMELVSPFHYYSRAEPLTSAVSLLDVGLLLALVAGMVAFAAWAFERRDVAV